MKLSNRITSIKPPKNNLSRIAEEVKIKGKKIYNLN